MFPRTYVIIKHLCQNTAKSPSLSDYCGAARRRLSTFQPRSSIHIKYDSLCVRKFTWTKVLMDSDQRKANKPSKECEAPPTENVQEKKPSVLNVLAVNIKGEDNKPIKKEGDINLGKTLEQSPPVTESVADKQPPIQTLKEKIVSKIADLKKDDTKTQEAAKIKKKKRVDFTVSSLARNFITPVRAMADFLLKPSDLESLPKTKRRSPYDREPPITVFWRKDVEAKALEIWGSKENLAKEQIKRDIEKRKYQQNIFTVKRRLRDYRRGGMGQTTEAVDIDAGLLGRSGRVVVIALAINTANFVFKLGAWILTGSHSMFSESIHSLADTINQVILAYGIHKSVQTPDFNHPYGYTNMRYVASLISGVGIFCVGTGLSFYHGISGLVDPQPLDDLFWGFWVLGGSLLSEGATLLVAISSIQKGARDSSMSIKDYIFRGQDPSVNVVLLEDSAAVIGVSVAAVCMGLSSLLTSPIPDAIGSLIIGGILGSVASFIIYTNVAALIGRSIPEPRLEKINAELESDVMVRAIHDVKGIDMGNLVVRYKAEVDFDGRELTRAYLDKQDLNVLLEEVKSFQNIDQLEEFLLKHGETIVDMLGGEIDRIEMKLRKNNPEIRHCDLEIL